jgi:hypothetical protein
MRVRVEVTALCRDEKPSPGVGHQTARSARDQPPAIIKKRGSAAEIRPCVTVISFVVVEKKKAVIVRSALARAG